MRIVRFEESGRVRWGEMVGDVMHELGGAPYEGQRRTGREFASGRVRLCAPVSPGKLIGFAFTYRQFAAQQASEMPTEPLMFNKAISTIIASGEPIRLPQDIGTVQLEGELVAVMSRRARRVSPGDARQLVFGYACGNDVSATDIVKRDRNWPGRGKSFDTFAPIGPWIETALDPTRLALRTRVNGALRQDGSTADMAFGVFDLVSFASQVLTLEPGDCIFTGTPAGACPIHPGDTIEIEIKGIGTLVNVVEAVAG